MLEECQGVEVHPQRVNVKTRSRKRKGRERIVAGTLGKEVAHPRVEGRLNLNAISQEIGSAVTAKVQRNEDIQKVGQESVSLATAMFRCAQSEVAVEAALESLSAHDQKLKKN